MLRVQVQSLVRELTSRKPHGAAIKKRENKLMVTRRDSSGVGWGAVVEINEEFGINRYTLLYIKR